MSRVGGAIAAITNIKPTMMPRQGFFMMDFS